MSVPVFAAYGFASLAVMMPLALVVLAGDVALGIAGPMTLSRISFDAELVVVVGVSAIIFGVWLDHRIPIRQDAFRAVVRARSLEKLRRVNPRAAEAIERFRQTF